MKAREAVHFVRAAGVFWFDIFPTTRQERRKWLAQMERIPDRDLRHDAAFTLSTKWGHAEGAAAFGTLVPRARRHRFVRMAVAFESLVDYLDTISERPAEDAYANTFHLHQALFAAIGGEPPGSDSAPHEHDMDGGYIAAQIDLSREIFLSFPSAEIVTPLASRLLTLYGEAQALFHSIEAGTDGSDRAVRTQSEARRNDELVWGEMIAAGASTVPILALLALAAQEDVSEEEAELVASSYYPWVSSLHILLHGLVDQEIDQANGLSNQLNHYGSPTEAAERIGLIADRARQRVSELPSDGDLHHILLSGMGGYYLAPSQVWGPERAEIAHQALGSLGPLAKTAMQVHAIRMDGRPRLRRDFRRPAPAPAD